MHLIVETDRALIAALPLPLSQTWRRALYVESAAAIHERSLFAIEAALKYAASVAVMSCVAGGSTNQEVQSACGALVKPSLGHWARMLRACREVLPGSHPASQWLSRIADQSVDNQVPGLQGRTVGAVLGDHLVAYRNSVSGHGSGLSTSEASERAPLLLALARGILSALAGDDSPQLYGRAGACTLRLVGPTAGIVLEDGEPPTPHLVLRFRDRTIPLAPLWVFDFENDDVLVLNKGAGLDKVEYLSYGNPRGASGLVTYREHRAEAAKRLLESVTGQGTLGTTEVETLINEAEVSELANRATSVCYGPFRVVRQIAAGGQGIVYEAIEEDPPRRVALKTLPLQRALSPSARQRLKEEAAALAQVEHPNIVPIYETGETDGIPWIAMKYVEGKSLDEILSQLRGRAGAVTLADFRAAASTTTGSVDGMPGKNYTARIVGLIRDAARALAACHARGIVHRDIKPSNLMVDTAGRVVLTDFGLARSVDARSQTFTQELVGTLQYLAPEALLPSGRSGPDERVDVYGLGATLYEGLALRRPFEEYEQEKAGLLHAVQTKDPQPLRRVAPAIPRELETVVMKAIERDRDRRYSTAAEFADDLDRFLRGEPVRARPAGPVTIAHKWVRRNPAKATMALAVLGLMLGLSLWRRAEQQRQDQAERQAAQVEKDVSYLDGALRSTLGLNRPGNESYLNTEMLEDASTSVELMLDRIKAALSDQSLRNTSYGKQFEERRKDIKRQQESMARLAEFYHQSDLAWFLTGAERDDEAREACELAAKSVGALEQPDWWTSLPEDHPDLVPKQIDQLKQDIHRQLILLAAMRAKPAAINFTEPPDKHLRASREALAQAERFQHSSAGALVDWFCRMRVGEKDLPPMPAPETATDHFLLGITHFWIAQFADSKVGAMVLSSAPPQAGLDLKNPAAAAIRHLRTACGMDPQQYWHHFSLAWALNEGGQKLLDAPGPHSEGARPAARVPSWKNALSAFVPGGQAAPPENIDVALTNFRDAELALNSCITLRPSFPRGYELRGRAMILQSLRLRKLDEPPPAAESAGKQAASEPTPDAQDAENLASRGMADFDRARQLAPNDPDVYWARAHALELLASHDDAVAAYGRAMQLDRPMGRLTGQQWVQMAQTYLSRITKGDEQRRHGEAWGVLALANWLLSQTDDQQLAGKFTDGALAAAKEALDIRNNDACALAVRGTIRLGRGESDLALADFDAALKSEPDSYLAAAGRALTLEQLKQETAALAEWDSVAQKIAVTDWQRREATEASIRLLERLGRADEAKARRDSSKPSLASTTAE